MARVAEEIPYLVQIREAVEYDPITGVFKRLYSAGNTKKGSVVGNLDRRGYMKAMVCKRYHKLHRLAWFHVHGVWPVEIDHKNQDKADNRLENLRECSTSENCTNQTGPRINNRAGMQGVHQTRVGKFRASFRGRHLGMFPTAELAHSAYLVAKAPHLPESNYASRTHRPHGQ